MITHFLLVITHLPKKKKEVPNKKQLKTEVMESINEDLFKDETSHRRGGVVSTVVMMDHYQKIKPLI